MRKTATIILCFLFAVSLTFFLSACNGAQTEKAKPTIIGTWAGEYNMSEFTGASGKVRVDFTFQENGTYKIAINEASYKAFIEEYLRSVAHTGGEDIDELLKESGTTFEEYVEESLKQANKKMNVSGKYKLEGNILYTNTDSSDEFLKENSMQAEISEESLKLSGEEVEVNLKRVQ